MSIDVAASVVLHSLRVRARGKMHARAWIAVALPTDTSETEPRMMDELAQRTIGDLGRLGHRLAMRCRSCGRFRYLKATSYRSDTIIADIGARLQCFRCLSHEVDIRCVSTDPVTGRWPAEGS